MIAYKIELDTGRSYETYYRHSPESLYDFVEERTDNTYLAMEVQGWAELAYVGETYYEHPLEITVIEE